MMTIFTFFYLIIWTLLSNILLQCFLENKITLSKIALYLSLDKRWVSACVCMHACVFSPRDGTKGLKHARQELYHTATCPTLGF
jgi:hypothetical protein